MDIIKVEKRNMGLKAKQLRRQGMIPCSIHGGQLKESLSVQMTEADAEQIFRTLRLGSTLYLELNGEKIPAQIKEMKRVLMGHQIEHMMFEALKADVEVNSVTHVFVKNEDLVPGHLEQMLYEIPITALPKDLVDTVTIDLAGRPEGTVITVADIPELMNDAIKLKVEPDSMVLRISSKLMAPIEEEETEAEA